MDAPVNDKELLAMLDTAKVCKVVYSVLLTLRFNSESNWTNIFSTMYHGASSRRAVFRQPDRHRRAHAASLAGQRVRLGSEARTAGCRVGALSV